MSLRFRKSILSISIIGKTRFWVGIIAGLLSAISLSLFIDYSREGLRVFSFMSRDLFTLPKEQVLFFDYFFATFSTVFGLGLSLWIWLSNPRHFRRKERLFKHFAQTNIFVIIWVSLMFIARWGTLIPIVLYSQQGYDNHLDLYYEGRLFFVLFPIVLFLNNWYTVRLVYKSGKWILFSFVAVIIISSVLANTKTVNRTFFNEAFESQNAYKYTYIEEEFEKASKYGVEFTEDTKRILKQNYTESTMNQVGDVQNAFNRNIKVSLDTLILEKIIIHHHKRKNRDFYHRENTHKNWSYAYPEQIYEQIKMCESDSIRLQYLFEILHEMILPLNINEPDWSEHNSLTQNEWLAFNQKRFYQYQTNTIISRLEQVADKLKTDSKYKKHHNLIELQNVKDLLKNPRQREYLIDFDCIDSKYNTNSSF